MCGPAPTAGLERNDLWPGLTACSDVREAWIPVAAAHRFAIRSGIPQAWDGRARPPVPAAPHRARIAS
ncbi:hypothetical protein GCM10010385_14870 [Streptomyces geysiriensis]|nr:hypothetical protein GCM10010385_14870 [Streptomyces geysiriensis]GGZ52275.1 hypothetical protein GCM10010301_26670 [Streptomyces plicatus]GHC35009.1 hypothetical protein GCM10010308_61570 [Streptomyces vinaceusdrappus]